MGRQEQPLQPGSLHDFASELRKLRADTGLTYRALARKAGYSATALSVAASGNALPSLDVLLAFVGACGGDSAAWEKRWHDASAPRRETGPCPSENHAEGGQPADEPLAGEPTPGRVTVSVRERPSASRTHRRRRRRGLGLRNFGLFTVYAAVLAAAVAVAVPKLAGTPSAGRPGHHAATPKPHATVRAGPVLPGWSVATGGAVVSTPAVADGIVYVASDDHYLYAFQAATGHILRRVNIGSENDSSPVVADGYVYAGSWNSDTVSAFNTTLRVRHWTFPTGSSIDSTPLIAGGAVFIGSDDHNMYALNATAGTRIWAKNLNGEINARPAVSGGRVFAGTSTGDPRAGRMYAMNAATGDIDWFLSTGRIDSGAVVAAGATMYFGSYDGRVWAVDPATGHVRWTFHTNGAIDSTPAVAAGTVYVGSDDGTLYALNAATGHQRWTYATGEYITDHPAVTGNVVYFGSYDHYVYALNASTGGLLWRHPTGGHVESSPTVANGIVYIGSDDGKFYALNANTGNVGDATAP
jgi:outer membrane protein assembly factor BamB/transcriptional regulator with XRE-family HTH domain